MSAVPAMAWTMSSESSAPPLNNSPPGADRRPDWELCAVNARRLLASTCAESVRPDCTNADSGLGGRTRPGEDHSGDSRASGDDGLAGSLPPSSPPEDFLATRLRCRQLDIPSGVIGMSVQPSVTAWGRRLLPASRLVVSSHPNPAVHAWRRAQRRMSAPAGSPARSAASACASAVAMSSPSSSSERPPLPPPPLPPARSQASRTGTAAGCSACWLFRWRSVGSSSAPPAAGRWLVWTSSEPRFETEKAEPSPSSSASEVSSEPSSAPSSSAGKTCWSAGIQAVRLTGVAAALS